MRVSTNEYYLEIKRLVDAKELTIKDANQRINRIKRKHDAIIKTYRKCN